MTRVARCMIEVARVRWAGLFIAPAGLALFLTILGGVRALAQAAPPVPDPLKQSGAQAIENIASQGVLGSVCALLFLAVMSVAGFIWRRQVVYERALAARDSAHAETLKDRDAAHDKERQEWQAQFAALQEARLAFAREVLTALGNSTAAISVNSQSIVERTASASELAKDIGRLVNTVSAFQEFFRSLSEEMKSQGKVNAESLQRLSYLASKP